MNEEDPGIDHLFAHILVADCQKEVIRQETKGKDSSIKFESFCGGVPAVPNDFCYKFSWAPAGVLKALLSPAQHIVNGQTVQTLKPWLAVENYKLDSLGSIEGKLSMAITSNLSLTEKTGFCQVVGFL